MLIQSICISLCLCLTYIDLTTKNGFTFHQVIQPILDKFKLFGPRNEFNLYLRFSIWMTIVFTVAIYFLTVMQSTIFAAITVAVGWGLGMMTLERLANLRLRKFEGEFLRFVQLMKSNRHLWPEMNTLTSKTIQKLTGLSDVEPTSVAEKDADETGELQISYFLECIYHAIESDNQNFVDSTLQVKKQLIDKPGIQMKSMALWSGFLGSIRDSGKIGRAFERLEQRIESDLAIQQELNAVTSGANLQMFLLCVIPLAVLGGYWLLMQDLIESLFLTTLGQTLISIAVAMSFSAAYLSYRILNIRV